MCELPRTNFDVWIEELTVEKTPGFIRSFHNGCDYCPASNYCGEDIDNDCLTCFKLWAEQEVSE